MLPEIETVESIKRTLESVEKEYRSKVEAIDKEINRIQTSGFNFPQSQVDELVNRRKLHEGVREVAVVRIQARLQEAERLEYEKTQAEKAKRDEQAAAIKAKALQEFVKVGGTHEEFEKVWPVIRSQMLQEATLRNIALESQGLKSQKIVL